MRLAWATDIHPDFLTSIDRRRFLECINEQADALVVTGDIAESNSLGEILRQMSAALDMPVYFVLGNHDFYRGSVAGTRADVEEMIPGSGNLVYPEAVDLAFGPIGSSARRLFADSHNPKSVCTRTAPRDCYWL